MFNLYSIYNECHLTKGGTQYIVDYFITFSTIIRKNAVLLNDCVNNPNSYKIYKVRPYIHNYRHI